MSNTNGGAAFPVPNDANVNGQEGMTLRDYFAAAALTGLLVMDGVLSAQYDVELESYPTATEVEALHEVRR
jgi:hypothetical protein